jgi:hypothetical protein
MQLPSVGPHILLVASINALLDGPVVWPLVGFTVTSCYLLAIGPQFWLATHHGRDPAAIRHPSRATSMAPCRWQPCTDAKRPRLGVLQTDVYSRDRPHSSEGMAGGAPGAFRT